MGGLCPRILPRHLVQGPLLLRCRLEHGCCCQAARVCRVAPLQPLLCQLLCCCLQVWQTMLIGTTSWGAYAVFETQAVAGAGRPGGVNQAQHTGATKPNTQVAMVCMFPSLHRPSPSTELLFPVAPRDPPVVLAAPSCTLLPTRDSCAAIPPLPGIKPAAVEVAVRGRFIVLMVGVCGRATPIMLLAAKLLLACIMDVVRPAREAAPARLLPPRPS